MRAVRIRGKDCKVQQSLAKVRWARAIAGTLGEGLDPVWHLWTQLTTPSGERMIYSGVQLTCAGTGCKLNSTFFVPRLALSIQPPLALSLVKGVLTTTALPMGHRGLRAKY